jgi:hypothetical protein
MDRRTNPTPRAERRRPKSSVYDHYASLPCGTDFRAAPHLYGVGRGEQGVLTVEPYKSELLPLWRFATTAAARRSAAALYRRFRAYAAAGDFVGMDMARKFIQMGYTRARRYANYTGGRKYGADGAVRTRGDDAAKAEAAAIFHDRWRTVREDGEYLARKRSHPERYG